MKFYFKQMLKVLAFYLDKQKRFIPKKNLRPQSLNMPREIQKMAFAVLNFSEGFVSLKVPSVLNSMKLDSSCVSGPEQVSLELWAHFH